MSLPTSPDYTINFPEDHLFLVLDCILYRLENDHDMCSHCRDLAEAILDLTHQMIDRESNKDIGDMIDELSNWLGGTHDS